jgi:hypothetical protein
MTEQVANAEPAPTTGAGGQTAPEQATTTATPAAAPSLDDELSAVYDRMQAKGAEQEQAKNALAKELSTPIAPEKTEDEVFKELTVSDEPAKAEGEPALSPAIAPPNSASAEIKALWATLPPKAQEFIAQREKDSHAKISEQGNELATFQPLRPVYEAMRHELGVHPGREAEVITNYLKADLYLRNDPIGCLRWLAESAGVDLAQAFGQKSQQAAQPPSETLDGLFRDERLDRDINPKVQKLEATVARLEGHLTARERADIAHRESTAQEIITKFSADKPYWADVKDDVTREVAILKQSNPRTPMEQLIQEGYDRAIWANKGVRERLLADQRHEADTKAEAARKAAEAEKQKQADKAKKMASLNQRTGSSASAPSVGGFLDDAALGAIYDRAVSGSR